MSNQSVTITAPAGSTRPALQTRIISGMRWTVWISALAVPFSFGTNAILARISPEAIGTYGLLAVYISLVAAFFYLGGDAVIIKFIPGLQPEKRWPFLASYFLVICLALCLWLLAVLKWPDKLHYLFGEKATPEFQKVTLCLSPVYILFSMAMATLKGLLEMPWAQSLMRALNIGSFCIYSVLYFFARPLLATHYSAWIWGIYLGLTAVLTALGIHHFRIINAREASKTKWHFFLPRGFWPYALATQQASAVWFFINRIDYILVLNFGNLEVLGKYVAIITIAMTIPLANNFILDSFLPSLTNLVAVNDFSAASQVSHVYLRVLFVVNTLTTCGLVSLAGMLTRILGSKYESLQLPVIVAVLLIGLAGPGAVGGTLLSGVGKQQRMVFVGIGQVVLYCLLLYLMWPRWRLFGAVVALGASMCGSSFALLIVALWSVPVRVSVAKEYCAFAGVAVLEAAATVALKNSLGAFAVPLWILSAVLFLILAGYKAAECRNLGRCFLPAWLGS